MAREAPPAVAPPIIGASEGPYGSDAGLLNGGSDDGAEHPDGVAPTGKNRRVGVGAITVALLVGAAYVVFGISSESHTVTGDLSLSASNNLSAGDSCTGDGGYSDIHEGTQVVVEDESGKTLATGAFGNGTFDGEDCVFSFSFHDVPKAAYYRIHGGNRGVLQYSYDDMVKANWSVHLSLGNNSGTD